MADKIRYPGMPNLASLNADSPSPTAIGSFLGGVSDRFKDVVGSVGSEANPYAEAYDAVSPEYGVSEELDYGVSEELSPREFARVFDPTSTEDVRKMQGMLGVEQDGILGPITLKALRTLQGVPSDDIEYGVSEELPQFYESVGEPAPFDYKTSADIDETLADFMLRHDGPERPVVPLDEDIDDFAMTIPGQGIGRLDRPSIENRFMQEPVSAAIPETNVNIFDKAMRNMNPNLGDYMSTSPNLGFGMQAGMGAMPKELGKNQQALIRKALSILNKG